jgi:hypothetical protein
MKLRASAILAIITAVLVLLPEAAAAEEIDQPSITIETVPGSVEITSGQEAPVKVVLRNTGKVPIEKTALSWLENDQVTISGGDRQPKTLAPYEYLEWDIIVAARNESPVATSVQLRIDYTWQSGNMTGPVSSVLYRAVPVKSLAPADTSAIAAMEVKSATESISAQTSGQIYVTVTNKYSGPITVTGIQPVSPEFVNILPASIQPTVIPVKSAEVFMFEMSANATVRPGKHLILFTTAIDWGEPPNRQSAELTGSYTVDVSIFGESLVLKVLEVPSVLLLPGVVTLVILSLLWKIKIPKDESVLPYTITAKSPEFWILAIAASIFIAFIYLFFSNLGGGASSSFPGYYGLADLGWISLSAIVLGIFIWAASKATSYFYIQEKEKRAEQRTPTITDNPLTILEKLAVLKMDTDLYLVKCVINNKEVCAYLLEGVKDPLKDCWVAPAIVLSWKDGSQDKALRDKILKQREAGNKVSDLAESIKQAIDEEALDLRWQVSEELNGPVKAPEVKLLYKKAIMTIEE